MNTSPLAFDNEEQRRRAVALTVALLYTVPAGSPGPELLPGRAAAQLPDYGLYQILYRSTAVRPLANAELLELLERARCFNLAHQITGLMLYSENQFVQVIEGPALVVRTLYTRIRQDARHHRVETMNEGPLPARRFLEWSMDFGFAAQPTPGTSAQQQTLPGLSTTSAHLKLLLEVFTE